MELVKTGGCLNVKMGRFERPDECPFVFWIIAEFRKGSFVGRRRKFEFPSVGMSEQMHLHRGSGLLIESTKNYLKRTF